MTGSAWRRSSAAPATPIRTPRPKVCTVAPSSWARSAGSASGRGGLDASDDGVVGDGRRRRVDLVRPRADRGGTVDGAARGARSGSDLPLTVERHVVATFRWAAPSRRRRTGIWSVATTSDRKGEDLYLVGPVHPGPQADPDAFDQEIREDEVRALAEAVVRRVPQLERSEVHGGWASLYDVSPDWQPVIGEVAPNVFVDAGTSGHGFKLAPALGRHVADLVVGDHPSSIRAWRSSTPPGSRGEARFRPGIGTPGSSADQIQPDRESSDPNRPGGAERMFEPFETVGAIADGSPGAARRAVRRSDGERARGSTSARSSRAPRSGAPSTRGARRPGERG